MKPVRPPKSAIDAALERATQPPPAQQRLQVSLIALPTAIQLGQGGSLRFEQPEGFASPRLMAWNLNDQAWQPILLAAGTWEIRHAPDDSLPPIAPKLWTPPGTVQ